MGRGKARKKRLLGQSHGLTVAVFPVESKKCGKRKTGKDKVIKNKTQTSPQAVSETEVVLRDGKPRCKRDILPQYIVGNFFSILFFAVFSPQFELIILYWGTAD